MGEWRSISIGSSFNSQIPIIFSLMEDQWGTLDKSNYHDDDFFLVKHI